MAACSSSSPTQNDSQPAALEASCSYSHDRVVFTEVVVKQNDSQLIALSAVPSSSQPNASLVEQNDCQAIPLSVIPSFQPNASLVGSPAHDKVLKDGCSSSKTSTNNSNLAEDGLRNKKLFDFKQILSKCVIINNERLSIITNSIITAVNAIDMELVDADLDELSSYITQLLDIFEENKRKPNPRKFARPNLSRSKKVISKLINLSKDVLHSADTKEVITRILEGMGTVQLVTTGLLVVVIILERCQAMKSNKEGCLSLVKRMNTLAQYVKQLKQRPHLKKEMEDSIKEATQLVMEGSLCCSILLHSSKGNMFLLTSEHKSGLDELQQKLENLHTNMQQQLSIANYDQVAEVNGRVQEVGHQMEGLNSQMQEVNSGVRDLDSGQSMGRLYS